MYSLIYPSKVGEEGSASSSSIASFASILPPRASPVGKSSWNGIHPLWRLRGCFPPNSLRPLFLVKPMAGGIVCILAHLASSCLRRNAMREEENVCTLKR